MHPAGPGQSDLPHIPVLLREVLAALEPLDGARVLDATFGAGGYSRALLEAGANVTGLDRDPSVTDYAKQLQSDFPDRFTFCAGTFAELDTFAVPDTDAIVLDIGVSSMQLDQAKRGFSFMRSGPLDMRMSGEGVSAADLVNDLGTKDLANLIFAFGEEKRSRRIAEAIVAARANARIETTLDLANLLEKTVGRKPGDQHPATRTFQALRIAVNGEFEQLVEGLFAAERVLPPEGRLAVVTFHSLEDRIVKRFLAPDKTGPARSRHLPQQVDSPSPWRSVAKPVKPSSRELSNNPRARSATLRSAVRSEVSARPTDYAGLGVPRFRREHVR